MKRILLFSVITLAVTANGAFAQMGGGQHMMRGGQQPQAQAQQGAYGMMGGYGMYPGMMSGYGMRQPMMGGYGMHPGMMGCCGMQQPMMGNYGMGQMHPGMMGYGMPHMQPGAGSDMEKQRKFMKETSTIRKRLHDLMFDHMEARWNPDTKSEQLEKLGREMESLQQELFEKSRELMK